MIIKLWAKTVFFYLKYNIYNIKYLQIFIWYFGAKMLMFFDNKLKLYIKKNNVVM